MMSLAEVCHFLVMHVLITFTCFFLTNYNPLKTVSFIGATLSESVEFMSGKVLRVNIVPVISFHF